MSSFRNILISILRLPDKPEQPIGELAEKIFPASSKYYWYRLLFSMLSQFKHMVILVFMLNVVLIGLGPSTISTLEHIGIPPIVALMTFLGAVALVFIVWIVVRLALVQFEYENLWYMVGKSSLRIREGVITVKEITVTFANVQNIAITQGPVQRLFGISDLRVDTAGGCGGIIVHGQKSEPAENLHTAWFRGLDNAEEVKKTIQQMLHRTKDSGLGEPIAPSSGIFDVVGAMREVLAESGKLRETCSQ